MSDHVVPVASGASVGAVLEQDHREIDQHFAAFARRLEAGRVDAELFAAGATGLRRHIWVEEELHFPPLRAAGLMGPIMVMLREHGEIWDLLDRLDAQLAASAAAPDLAATWEEVARVLEAHNLKEERILYPSGDQVIDANTAAQILAALDGELPTGWTCEMSGRS